MLIKNQENGDERQPRNNGTCKDNLKQMNEMRAESVGGGEGMETVQVN